MATTLTLMALVVAIPATIDADDLRAFLIGCNALIWAGLGMAVA